MKQTPLFSKRGFTLIELLVVIFIIGLLAVVVLVSLNTSRTNAKYARAKQEIQEFLKSAVIAQGTTGQTLRQITGNGWSEGPCMGLDLRALADSHACVQNWYNAIAAIQTATGNTVQGLVNMRRDPWGSPYGLDENELEFDSSDCRFDSIRTAGPDGVIGTGDDYSIRIPHIRCP